MIFRQLFDSASSTYSYLLASRRGGEALIIDPVLEKVDRYIQLLNELDHLNDRTWRADIATRDRWGREGLDHGASLEVAAKFGWSLMQRLATEAVRHKLPIILDY